MRIPIHKDGDRFVLRVAFGADELHHAEFFIEEFRRAASRAGLHIDQGGGLRGCGQSEFHSHRRERLRRLGDGPSNLTVNEAQVAGEFSIASWVIAPQADGVRAFVIVRARNKDILDAERRIDQLARFVCAIVARVGVVADKIKRNDGDS